MFCLPITRNLLWNAHSDRVKSRAKTLSEYGVFHQVISRPQTQPKQRKGVGFQRWENPYNYNFNQSNNSDKGYHYFTFGNIGWLFQQYSGSISIYSLVLNLLAEDTMFWSTCTLNLPKKAENGSRPPKNSRKTSSGSRKWKPWKPPKCPPKLPKSSS